MTDQELRNIFSAIKTIAVVGVSQNQDKPAYGVASYLQSVGYKIVPVNPACDETLGEKCYPTLEEIPFPVDAVDVFRKSEFTPEIARSAVKIGAKLLWLQDGVSSEEAEQIARNADISFKQNDCMFRQRVRLFGFGK